jgi:hypothetical protein
MPIGRIGARDRRRISFHGENKMSKHKKNFTAEVPPSSLSTKAEPQKAENRLVDDNLKSRGDRKKEISGIWPILIFWGLLLLVLLLGWLTK